MPTFHSKRAPVSWDSLVARTRPLTLEERRAHSASVPPTFEFMVTTIEQDTQRSSSDVHLFGVTRTGDSVHCTVTNFHASFFIEMPCELHANDLETVRSLWNTAIQASRRYVSRSDPIAALSVHLRESLMYYKGGADHTRDGRENFIRVDLGCPADQRDVRAFFAGELGCKVALPHGAHRRSLVMYEDEGLKFIEQFQRTKRISGFGWVTLERHSLDRRSLSHCTWDLTVSCENVTSHRSDENAELYGAIAPLRVATFDIECQAMTRAFPSPERDPVIQIAVHIKQYGTSGERMVLDAVLALGDVDPFEEDDTVVLACFETERELLLSFRALLLAADYDISRGYNQRTFDWPYLFDRAATLGIDEEFGFFSRLRSVPATIRPPRPAEEEGFGATRDPDVPGRCDFDVLAVVRENYKYNSYRLNSVSLKVLKQTKEDVHHSMISVLQRGSSTDRHRLARYCRKDALLPALIDERLLLLIRYIELARVSGITLETLTRYAQQARVISALAGIANEFGFLLPLGQQLTPFEPEGQYDGGLVLEPVVGFHDDAPIVCLDFSSLYPSLGLAHNTDYTTLLRPEDVASMRPEDYERSEDGHAFVRRHVRKGLLQVLWERTLEARNVAKRDMKACKQRAEACAAAGDVAGEQEWKFKESVQDARQQALKLLGNAAYGFTGVSRKRGGKLSAFEIPSAITSYGRQALRRVCTWVNREFPEALIVYGDSVTGDTPVLLRRVSSGETFIQRFDEIDVEWSARGEKEEADTRGDLEVWTERGFSPIKRIIRHYTTKPIIRVHTPTGSVDVTPDHSLLLANGTEISPTDVTLGTELLHVDGALPIVSSCPAFPMGVGVNVAFRMGVFLASGRWTDTAQSDWSNIHYVDWLPSEFADVLYNNHGERRVPRCILSGTDNEVASFLCGYEHAQRHDLPLEKEARMGLWMLYERRGADLIVLPPGPMHISSVSYFEGNMRAVDHLTVLHNSYDGYVYDFETENHHFHVGPGRLVVHNTDSVMVKPGCKTVEEAFAWMRMVAERITREEFGNEAPMKLAPEKVMFPMLSIAKKRYIDGYYEESPTTPDKVHYRGVEVVRRDSCELMATCLQTCCEHIFLKRDVAAAVQCAKDVVQRLYLNQVNMSELLMSKTLSMPPEKYANPQPHSVLALKMTRRDPSTAPVVGERVPFVMIGSGVDSIAELAEDPLYALEHEIPINVRYYIERQLKKPLERLFVPIIGEARTAEIFSGEHTRKRVQPRTAEKAATQGIMAFMTVLRTCAKCRSAYDPKVHKHPSLCAKCVDEHGERASDEKRARYEDVKARYDAQMQVCQTCQGSDRDPVLCMARDCRELYKRKDLEKQCRRMETDMEDMVALKRQRTST